MIDFIKSIVGVFIHAVGLKKVLLRRFPKLTKLYVKKEIRTDFQDSNPILHWWSSVFFAILMSGVGAMCWVFAGMVISI